MSKLNNSQIPDTLSSKTIDNTNSIDTTTTNLSISGGSNGQVLSTDGSGNLSWATAGGGGLGAPTYVVTKTADETITSSTTLQDDDHLYQELTGGKTYWIELNLIMSRGTSTGNLGIQIAIDGNSEGHFGNLSGMVSTLMNGTAITTTGQATTPSVVTRYPIGGVIKLASTYTLKVKWSPTTNDTTPRTAHKGSQMVIWEVA